MRQGALALAACALLGMGALWWSQTDSPSQGPGASAARSPGRPFAPGAQTIAAHPGGSPEPRQAATAKAVNGGPDPLLQPGRHRLNRVLPRTGGGTDHDRAAPTHKHFHVAAFVDATRGPVDVVQPHFHACHQPVQAPQRPAQPVRGALLPQLTFTVVGSKVKLHDQGLEKLRQPDFGADAEPEKAASL